MFGGRNNKNYEKLHQLALNDLHILDTEMLEWQVIAMYGIIPPSRWGHILCASDRDKLIIFGGLTLKSYISSQVSVFDFNQNAIELMQQKVKELVEIVKKHKLK